MKERRRRRRRCRRNCIRLFCIKQGANVNGSHRYPLLEYLVISRVSLASDVRAKVEIIEYDSIPFDPITLHSIPFDSLIASVVRHDYRGRR